MEDKNRKRGLRIAEKRRYRNHARDNGKFRIRQHNTINCWSCEGWRSSCCDECAFYLYHARSNGPALDNEMREYLQYGAEE